MSLPDGMSGCMPVRIAESMPDRMPEYMPGQVACQNIRVTWTSVESNLELEDLKLSWSAT